LRVFLFQLCGGKENRKEKTLIQKITVAVAFELETGNTKNPDIKVNMDTIE